MLLSPIPSFVLCTVRWHLLEMRNCGECQQLKGPYPAKPLKHTLLPSRSLHTPPSATDLLKCCSEPRPGSQHSQHRTGQPWCCATVCSVQGTELTADLCTAPMDRAVPSAALLRVGPQLCSPWSRAPGHIFIQESKLPRCLFCQSELSVYIN